ncbi:hypothetical protein [Flavobacterium sp. CF136]|uniref:hypothetical protein n=1 Tax=Flavobacterium sp. (strain CF136) TaxID=1144313 RepID=UPI0002719EF9|nr:hypothetical protein [Flavobacterium sp. CF136]EJL66279.1 hypothetical protein PMI10_00627 [Flavobacterium sp. CF136]
MNLEHISVDKIETIKIVNSVWTANTTIYNPNKIEIEVKGVSEINAYENLLKFLSFNQKPTEIKELPNGNKIYQFKNKSTNAESEKL